MNFDDINNNFNDGFDEARRIIADAQRFRPTSACCIPPTNGGGTVGPTGATGPTGPIGATGATGSEYIINYMKIHSFTKKTYLLIDIF